MTLNLRFGLAQDGPNRWDHRKKAFPALLRKYASDIIGFQEANDFQIDFLKDLLSDYAYIGQRSPAPSFWQNNILFYKRPWQCVADDHFFLSATPDIPSRMPKSRWPRQGTIGVFKYPSLDRVIVCANTHFDFEPAVQTASALIVLERLNAISAGHPTILMGDFNTHPDSPCHQVFTAATHLPGRGAAPFRNIWQDSFPGTFHGFTGRSDSRHIDWVLYRGPLSLNACRVIRDPFNSVYPSDHFPVQADFNFDT